MEAAPLKDIRAELKGRSAQELQEIVLRLGRFKKENKELLSYLLFESQNERDFVEREKEDMEVEFAQVHDRNYYLMKKGTRKVLSKVKRTIRYSSSKETEVDLLLHFCRMMKETFPHMQAYPPLENIFDRQLAMARRKIDGLHEDLQYDYGLEWQELAGE